MRTTALFLLALTCGSAPAAAGLDRTQHCTTQSLSDGRAQALFGGTGPYEFDIVIHRPARIDQKATAASLASLAKGEVREDWISPGAVGFKFYATARDGKEHRFDVTVNHQGDIGYLTEYGVGRNPIGKIFRLRCERLDALNGHL